MPGASMPPPGPKRRLSPRVGAAHDLAAKGSTAVETLPDRVSARIFSRLAEMCDFIELRGPDSRTLADGAAPHPRSARPSKAPP